MIASSLRDGRRLILVLNGLKNMQERADESAKILEFGYREYGLYRVVKQGQTMAEAPVWLGKQTSVPLVAGKDVVLTLPRKLRDGLRVALSYSQPMEAPIAKDQTAGLITVTAPGLNPIETPLVAGADVPRLCFFARFWAKLKWLIGKT